MSNIEWTNKSWNPIRGCSRVSDGCKRCYAETVAWRFKGPGQPYEGLVRKVNGHPTWNGKVKLLPEKLAEPLRWRKPRRIFVNSMSDLFHENVPGEFIARVFAVMASCHQHTFQILTKRPERMREWLNSCGDGGAYGFMTHNGSPSAAYGGTGIIVGDSDKWPLPNVHLGVSVEGQESVNDRLVPLMQTPAAVRFVSYEPALDAVDWATEFDEQRIGVDAEAIDKILDWVIVGGESGPGARPCDVAWIRSTVEQCRKAGVPCFVKQLGAKPRGWCQGINFDSDPSFKHRSDFCDAREASEGGHCGDRCVYLKSRKGNDMNEWPVDLRVREWPT